MTWNISNGILIFFFGLALSLPSCHPEKDLLQGSFPVAFPWKFPTVLQTSLIL